MSEIRKTIRGAIATSAGWNGTEADLLIDSFVVEIESQAKAAGAKDIAERIRALIEPVKP